MFLLDTNVLSALINPTPPVSVLRWIAEQNYQELFTASVCQAELLAGLAIMPQGQRRHRLERAAERIFDDDFDGQILAFDAAAAEVYAHIFAGRRRMGRPMPTLDLMIAATAMAHSAEIVTRNVSDFEGCGVVVINPWDE
ncbi:MAG TPA: type II toxin-antitoxin system VapC family toxin [Stellaceae bacterium]|jgi:predicted nucleic acid-binding protein|nr:type II toxin-antitoxin system VapC family toxin [Stellaceae bacterium]